MTCICSQRFLFVKRRSASLSESVSLDQSNLRLVLILSLAICFLVVVQFGKVNLPLDTGLTPTESAVTHTFFLRV